MDRLDESTATAIASFLEDERDVASLACSNTFWRNVLAPGNDPLWSAVLARRFGDSRKADDCAAHFRQLAALTKPAARLDTIIWLDGHHLRVLEEPGGPLLRLEAVCWLEIGGVLSTGVVPGRYRVAWRLHLEVIPEPWNVSLLQQLALNLSTCSGMAAGQQPMLGKPARVLGGHSLSAAACVSC
jgi:hypothetical protein